MAPHKAIKRLQCLLARFLEYSKSQNLEIGLDLLSPFPKDEGGKRNGSFKEGVDGGIGGRGIRVSRRELMVGLVMGVTFLVPIRCLFSHRIPSKSHELTGLSQIGCQDIIEPSS
ncbi:hypothetical protein OsI_38485 [Oryza sativa Indica Group]|uniref:Uncharacterized protein n=1 Tax=Oryza sativa subsp. indica TaxID=39946 RepID=A2ZKZ2_ORYSI|nr:hypothetical protein OsI_38485 [Oryza sativa Indica Group]